MGPSILAAVVVETVLAAYRIRTRSQVRRARAVTRIVWCAAVPLLLGVRLIEWGPRYWALVMVSLLLVSHGLSVLVRGTAPDEPLQPWHAARSAVLVTLLMLVATLPAIIFLEYDPVPPTGEHPVTTATRTYLDPARPGLFIADGQPRRLTVGFRFPDVPRDAPDVSSPLVVYSHGGAGIRTANRSLFTELATHGYVVASIDHTHHSLYTTDANGQTTWTSSSTTCFVRPPARRRSPRTPSSTATVAVMGRSLGGAAALGIGRIRDDLSAVGALKAPVLWDIEGVAGGEFVWNEDPYPVPVLHIYSDSSWGHLAEWPQYAANRALLGGTASSVVNVHLAGVGHFGLTDLALSSPLLTRILEGHRPAMDPRSALEAVNEVTLGFVDTHRQEGVVAPRCEGDLHLARRTVGATVLCPIVDSRATMTHPGGLPVRPAWRRTPPRLATGDVQQGPSCTSG